MNMKKRVLSVVSVVAMILSATPLSSTAKENTLALYDEVEKNGIYYYYIGDENGGGWAASIADSETSDCVIPELIQGYPVTGVYLTHTNSNIVSITLPSTVVEISMMYCSELQEYKVSEQNERFSSKDGVLYDKSGETLIYYPPARDTAAFAVPESVQVIGECAFYECDNLTEIILPESLKLIDTAAFSEMSNLTELTIPAQVTEVRLQYFDSALQTVTLCCEDTELFWDAYFGWKYSSMFHEYLGFASVYVPDEAIKSYKGIFNKYIRNGMIEVLPISEKPTLELSGIAGDINNDGVLSIADTVLLQKWLLSAPNTHLANWKAADFCENGKLDVFDLCLMKQRLIEQLIV